MAGPNPIEAIKDAIYYGQQSDANLQEMKDHCARMFRERMTQNGGQIVSGTANGSSFSTNYPFQTMPESILRQAIQHIENGTRPTSRTIARLA
jgi:hypothetical protein